MEEAVKEITVPVYARMMHDRDGKLNRVPYSIDNRAIYSVSRGELNRRLLTEAEKFPNVKLHLQPQMRGRGPRHRDLSLPVTER